MSFSLSDLPAFSILNPLVRNLCCYTEFDSNGEVIRIDQARNTTTVYHRLTVLLGHYEVIQLEMGFG